MDSYFNAFENIVSTLNCSRDIWHLLLQCKLIGKCQEVCAMLSINDSLDYDQVKATVLRNYELVPEAYIQKFRACEKWISQTYSIWNLHERNLKKGVQQVKLALLKSYVSC